MPIASSSEVKSNKHRIDCSNDDNYNCYLRFFLYYLPVPEVVAGLKPSTLVIGECSTTVLQPLAKRCILNIRSNGSQTLNHRIIISWL
jgi:hypothetical protein